MNEPTRELYEAATREPTNREAYESAAVQLRADGEWVALVDLSVLVAQHAELAAEAASLLRAAGEVAETQLEDLSRALELYGMSLDGDPDGRGTLQRMRVILGAAEAWEDYVHVAEAEVERITDDAERAALLTEMGQALEHYLGDAERAMVCYHAAIESDPGSADAMAGARRIYRSVEDYEAVAHLLDMELKATDDVDREAAVYLELGTLLVRNLDQPELARHCFAAYMQRRPDDVDAARLLDQLGGPPADDEAAADAGDDDADVVASRSDGADVATTVGAETIDSELTAAVESEASRVVPESVEASVPVEAREAGGSEVPAVEIDLGNVAAALAEIEARAAESDGTTRRSLLLQAAEAANTHAPGSADVARLYAAAFEAAPGDPTLYLRVGRMLDCADDGLAQIAAVIDAAIEAASDERAAGITAERVVFGAQWLGEAKTADRRLRELLRKAPDDAHLREWQIQRFVETDKWRNIQQILVESLGGDQASSRIAALRQMAEMAESRADKPDKALDFWRQVHMADKADAGARRALIRLYRANERWSQYADVLRLDIDAMSDEVADEKLVALRELASAYSDHVKDDNKLVAVYGKILELDPADADTLAAVVDKYDGMRRWPDLVSALQMQAAQVDDVSARVAIRLRIAELYADKFRNQAEAIKAYEAVLEDDASNRPAIEALQAMYAKRRDWEKLVATQRLLADLEEDIEVRVAKYRDIAEGATKTIRRPDICTGLWEQVLDLAPADETALTALVGLYEQTKEWERFVEAVDRLVDAVDDDKSRIELLQKSGAVLHDRIGDTGRSIDVWRRLLEIDPTHRRTADNLKKAYVELSDWDGLTALFAARDQWDELVRVLEGQVGVQGDDEIRIALLFRAARIWNEELGQPDRTVRALERVLQIDPQHVGAARTLEPIYEEHEDYRKLAGTLEVMLGHEEDGSAQRSILMRISRLNEKHLRSPEAAFEWMRRVVESRADDTEARAELERLGGAIGEWGLVHDDLQVALEKIRSGDLVSPPTLLEPDIDEAPDDTLCGEPSVAGEPSTELSILSSLGRILDREIGAYDDALARYLEVLDLDTENSTALDAVEALYTRSMQWRELLGVLDRKLDLTDRPEERKTLLRKQGVVLEEQLDDADAAIEKHRAILGEDEADAEALEALRRLYDAGGDHPALHEILQRQLQLATLEEADATLIANLEMQIGLIALHALDRPRQAIDLFRNVIERDPSHTDACDALEGLLAHSDHRDEVARILEPIYEGSASWEKLVGALEVQLEHTEEPRRRFGLLELIGGHHIDRNGDLDRAFGAFARALREMPDSEPTIGRLVELADASERYGELADLLESIVSDIGDVALVQAHLVRLGALYETSLIDFDRAIDAQRRLLEIDPVDFEAIEALDRLYARTEQWPPLLDVYRQKLMLADGPEIESVLRFQIANLLEEMLEDPAGAIATYVEILERDPTSLRALEAADRLYEQQAMWPQLGEIIERQLEVVEADARTPLRVRLAALNEGSLDQPEVAVEIYSAVLRTEPENAAAIEALERLMARPEFRGPVADILRPIYEALDEWHKLIGVYEVQAEHAPDGEARVALLHAIAELHERRGAAPEQAFDAYARAFAVDPGQPETLVSLHRIAEALELWGELVAVYRGGVDTIDDVVVATDVHKRIARIEWDERQQTEAARTHFEAAYANDDTDFEVISALEEIYFETEQWEAMVGVLRRKAELTEDLDAKKDLLFRTCAIYDEMLEDLDSAVGVFRIVLEVDPEDGRALDALERIFLALERWEELLDVLHRKAALSDDIAVRKDTYYVIGAAYDRELEDPLRAVETFCRVLEWDPDDRTALQHLDPLYLRLEQWPSLHEVLDRLIELTPEVDERIEFQHRRAKLREEFLGDVAGAVDGYKAILDEVSLHEPSLVSLEALIRSDSGATAASAVLEPALQAAAAWDRLIAMWRDLLRVTAELKTRTRLYLQIGLAHDEMLGQPEQAFDAYAQGFREDPADVDVLDSLEGVAASTSGWDAYVRLVEEQLAHIDSDAVVRDLCLRVARVFEEEVASNVDAIEHYRRALEFDSDCELALLALDRLYQKEGMWVELGEVLRIENERAPVEERVPILLRLASLQENALDDVGGAVESYREVFDITPQEPEALANLERIFEAGREQPVIGAMLEEVYVDRENWPRLHYILESRLPYLPEGEERMRGMHRLAQISLQRLDDTTRAFDWHGRAFGEVPEDETSREQLRGLAEQTGRFADLVAVYTDGLQNTQDLDLLRSVSHEIAHVHRTHLGDDESAERMYQYILELEEADLEALRGLDALYEGQHRFQELVGVLEREIALVYEAAPQIDLRFRLGQTFESRLADLERAVGAYRSILDVEPAHVSTLDRLEQIYGALEDWEALFEIHGRQRDIAVDDLERARLCTQMATIAGERLGRADEAVELLQQVLDLSGDSPDSLRALETLYELQGRWRELVDVCERQLSLADHEPAREIELYSKLGEVWGTHLERESNAIENWQNVLARDPANIGALWALRHLFERTEAWEELANTVHLLLDVLPSDDAHRVELYRLLGRLYQTTLDRPGDAVFQWGDLLEIEPYDAEAVDALEVLYTEAEDWESCVGVLERKAQITDDLVDRVGILFAVAEMAESRLGEIARARTAYTQILELQSDNLDASEHLERLYESAGEWEELVNLLLTRVEQTDDAYSRAELFERTSRVFEAHLGSQEHAFLVISQAFEEVREDDRLGPEIERLAVAAGKWSDAVALYENVLQTMGAVVESVPLHLRVARWHDEHFDTPERAATHYQQVLAIEPDNLSAMDALETLLVRYQRWPEVGQVLQRRAELTVDLEEKRETLEKMAHILEERLDDVEGAIHAYTQVIEIDDTRIDALRALERLYAQRQRWPELVDVLRQQTTVVDDGSTQVEIYLRIGELYEGRLGSPEQAIEAYREALGVDPTSLDAMRSLEKLYTAQDRWSELLDIYDMMLEVLDEPEQQLQIFSRMAIIREEELGDIPGTISMYRRMLEIETTSQTAVRALERLYRDSDSHEELAEHYANYLDAVSEPAERVTYFTRMADLFRGPLREPYRAIESLTPILDIDPQHRETLSALGELYAEVEDWPSCIEALSRESHLLTDRPSLLDCQYRVGRVYEEKLNDREQAERWYRGALDHDPNYVPALEALVSLYQHREDWPEVVRILKMMEAATRSFPEKSRWLFETGRVYETKLDDHSTAIDFYEQAFDMHPENVQAAGPLAAEYLAEERWERAEPMLDLLLADSGGRDLRELQKLHYNLGQTAMRLHNDDKALKHFRSAWELDSTHLPTLRGMGELLYKREDWDRAFKIFQTILVHHREHQSPEENTEIFYRQGLIKLKVSEIRKATDFFRKALDLNPRHVESLAAIVDLYERQSDWENAVHYRRQLIRATDDPRERFDALLRIGDIFREYVRNGVQAVVAYNEALELQPDSRLVLSKLLELYEGTRQWPEAVNILSRLADMETDPSRQAKYYYAVAVIQRDELKDHFIAVRTFDKALDADPKLLKAFAAIDQILTKSRDYARQDRYYRKMLKRANDHGLDTKLIINLARNLGEINRTRLKKYDEAIKAYKIALAKQPDDPAVLGIVAELYELNNETDKAINHYYRIIELDPHGIEAYHMLRHLFYESKRWDEAWCVCQVLTYLNQASADERALYEKYRSKTLPQARTPLDSDQWARVYHPEESMLLARLFARLMPYTAPLIARNHKELQIHKRKDLLNLTEPTSFNNVLNYVRQVTRLSVSEAYRAPQGWAGLWNANLVASGHGNPATLLVGPDMLSGKSLQELAFMLAKQLFLMSNQHYLASIETTYERRKAYLLTIVYTLTRLVNRSANVPFSDDGLLERYDKSISPTDLAEMAKLIQKMSENPRQHLNLSKWLEMVEHSGNRLGFVLSNDLGAAIRSIKNEPGQFSKAPTQDRIRELVLYGLSPSYFKLRKELGVAIQ